MSFDFGVVIEHWPKFLQATLTTLYLSGISMCLALVAGIPLMVLRTGTIPPLRWLAMAIIEVVRNTPFLVQVFFVFFGLPSVGLRLSPETAAIMTLTLNGAAYLAEILRGGFKAVPRGLIEAGRALNLSTVRIFTDIMFRPALRAVYPALCSQFILLLLTSSVVASISAEELTYTATVIDAETFRSVETYVTAAAIYLALSQAFGAVFKAIGRFYFTYPVK